MAPKGFRNFSAETLASDDLDGYCAWQSVMVFASASARAGDSGLSTNQRAGMVSFLEDINTLQYYDGGGSGWLNVIPAGSLQAWAGDETVVPNGWLLCDGTAVSRTTYAGLFTAIGETYGAGNGTSTFNVPNLKGRIPVGKDAAQTEFDTRGETGGSKTHTLTESEIPFHDHGLTSVVDNLGTDTNLGFAASAGADLQVASPDTTGTGGGAAHQNMPPYLVVSYLIKV